MNTPVIEVVNLTKTFTTYQRREGVWGSVRDLVHRRYEQFVAVDNINFTVNQGELLGYLGPNGAGKSTSIKMLTGILKSTSGTMKVMGFDPFTDRKTYTKQIGVVFGQRTQLWWDIAVIESFRLLRRIYDVPKDVFEQRLATLTEILDLESLLHTPVRKLSLGQRMRCDLAASLLHEPKVLFLDEPTIGLDAVGKDKIRTFLRRINREFGTTIILTTHDLQEIEELCERIIVLDHGKIIYDGSLAAIKRLPGLERTLAIDFSGPAPVEFLQEKFGDALNLTQESERRVRAKFDPAKLSAAEIIKSCMQQFDVADLTLADPGIEEFIMKIYTEGVGQLPIAAKNE